MPLHGIFSSKGGWLSRAPTAKIGASEAPGAIWVGRPPALQNALPPPDVLEKMQAVARKFDVAVRDERNRSLGKAGEERVLHHERAILTSAGRSNLARKVRWVSQEDGDGAGYDISSFTPDGRNRLIEVKTTNGWEPTPFHISRNELAVADENRDSWSLFSALELLQGVKSLRTVSAFGRPRGSHGNQLPGEFPLIWELATFVLLRLVMG